MIRPDILTRDDSRGLTYFIAELREDAFALFSLYDSDAVEGKAARLEVVGETIEDIYKMMRDAFREQIRSKNAPITDTEESPESDEAKSDADQPVRRKRRQLS